MTRGELTELLTGRFQEDFAEETARRIGSAADLELLYDLVSRPGETLARNMRHRIFFRGAYVLERIYFEDPARFRPFLNRFCRNDFADCTDASARRHFAKIMAHLLRSYTPEPEWAQGIAAAAAEWAVDPGTKVAVKVWAVEVLKCCRRQVDWVAESWDDILEAVARDATPGIANRLRKSWRMPKTL